MGLPDFAPSAGRESRFITRPSRARGRGRPAVQAGQLAGCRWCRRWRWYRWRLTSQRRRWRDNGRCRPEEPAHRAQARAQPQWRAGPAAAAPGSRLSVGQSRPPSNIEPRATVLRKTKLNLKQQQQQQQAEFGTQKSKRPIGGQSKSISASCKPPSSKQLPATRSPGPTSSKLDVGTGAEPSRCKPAAALRSPQTGESEQARADGYRGRLPSACWQARG